MTALARIRPTAQYLQPSVATDEATVTLVLKRHGAAPAFGSRYSHFPSHRGDVEAFAALHGAHPDAIAAARQFLAEHGLTEVSFEAHKRSLKLKGTHAQLEHAFGVTLHDYLEEGKSTAFRAVHGEPTLPEGSLAVLGLDRRPVAKPYFKPHANAQDIDSLGGSFVPAALGKLYNFPKDFDGKGQCIAIIELGGGYTSNDMVAYFHSIGLTPPPLVSVSVDGTANSPGGDADGEVQLDIEVAGALAPGASLAVYFTPNTDEGFHDAILAAAHDVTNKPLVMSISWGGPENNWGSSSIQAIEAALEDAAAFGVNITAAAGDNGAADGEKAGTRNADYPASSPSVLSCGGTHLVVVGGVAQETVWNDDATSGDGATGGGVSAVFPLPTWQSKAGVPLNPEGQPGRGVPDVSGLADPDTGYRVSVNGEPQVVGGTSAVAPLWAALLARLNQASLSGMGRPIKQFNQAIYTYPAAVFHDISQGINDGYSATKGWDATTGLGTPNGQAIWNYMVGQFTTNA